MTCNRWGCVRRLTRFWELVAQWLVKNIQQAHRRYAAMWLSSSSWMVVAGLG